MDMNTSDFFMLLEKGNGYFGNDMEDKWLDDVGSFQDLFDREGKGEKRIFLEMIGKDVRVPFQLQLYHCFLVLVKGYMKVEIISPLESENYSLYPYLHPSFSSYSECRRNG